MRLNAERNAMGYEVTWMAGMKRGLMVLVMLAVAVAAVGRAQSTNGTIAGTVVDTTGAAIPDATVTATNLQTGTRRTATTNNAGGYRIEAVQPGEYQIVLTAPSFAATTIPNRAVTSSAVTSANATLGVGSATATVEVGAVAAGLQTDSGELSETLSSVEVQNLPVTTLNPYELATTLPGVTTATAVNFTNGFEFSANGTRPRDNNFLIEGADNNDQGLHGQAFQPNNLEAVDQVTFLLNSFSPEYGGGGSVSNLLFQSGTNKFHGAVFERLFNSSLDATDHADVLVLQSGGTNGKTKGRESVFGFRLGGPIFKDRAFFFVSNQWERLRSTANAGVLTLPTAAGYAVLNQYAASNPRVANLLHAYGGLVGVDQNFATTEDLGNDPVTGNPRGTVAFAGVQRSLGNDQNARELEATSDVNLSSADKLRFRFIQAPQSTPVDVQSFASQLPGFDTLQYGTTYNAGITETHVFNAKVVNELRLSWSRIGFVFDLTPKTYANPLALTPQVSFLGITGYGIPAGFVPSGRFQNTYQLQDAINWTVGRHTLKVGFDVADTRVRDGIPFNFYGAIPYEAGGGYSELGNYLDDYSGNGNLTATISFGSATARPVLWSQSYYVQDSWKAMSNLELDLGMRYEYHGTPFNFLPYPAFDINNPGTFPSKVNEVADRNNFGPRFGFNYQPSTGSKFVVSGGVGVFYSHVFTNLIDNVQGTAPNISAKSVTPGTSGRGTPNWSQILTVCSTCKIKSTLPVATDTANVINPHLVDPITYEYNLRLQRELPGSFVLAAEYVGSRTEKNYATEEFNPTTASGARVIPNRGRIILEDNEGDANYNALQMELTHAERHGLSLRTAYTYAKLLDDGSEVFTDQLGSQVSTYAEVQRSGRRREYGPSAFDHRHRFVASLVYTPPKWHAEGMARPLGKIVNGFTFATITNFQSGNPLNVEIGADWNGDGISNDRPILLNKKAPITHWAFKGEDFFPVAAGTLCDGPEALATNDDCKVVSPADTHWVLSHFGTTENTISRDALTTDHTSNTDLSVQRTFQVTEHQDFAFRVEALNVWNQGNTGSNNPVPINATLFTGVPFNGTDATGQVFSGAVTFDNKYLTTAGGRSVRIYARYEF